MAQPDFWNNQEKAQKLISETNRLKEKRENVLDDGRVIGHVSAADLAQMEQIDGKKQE